MDANTIASQLDALRARIGGDGLELETELSFVDEGSSGSTLLRPALERWRDQAAAGSFDRLYVHSPDRLARNYAYQVLRVEELQRQGVDIVFHNHAIGQTPEENLLLQVQLGRPGALRQDACRSSASAATSATGQAESTAACRLCP